MKLIENNPYRIAGILSNATERELQRQKGRITAHARVGKETESDFDFQFLSNVSRKDIVVVNKAFANIQQNQDKVNFALFWFLNANPFDNTAIEYLKNGDAEKAVEIWEKVTINKEVNSKNFSAFNNLGTYKLLSQTQKDIKEGIEAKIKLIESDFFESFVHCVAGIALKIDNEKQINKIVDELLTQFKNQYSSSETIQLFSECNDTTQKYLSKKLTGEPIHRIESLIESCKEKRKEKKENAFEFGLRLFTSTKEDLSLLKSIIGINDLNYKTVADSLANEIMQCGIDYFNESQENNSSENYLESSLRLTKLADSIAVGKLAKDRAKDSLASLEELKDQEINQAIALLSSIKLAYEKAINQIDDQVSGMKRTMPYNQSINYSKVDKMKADCLDWSKVAEIISKGISLNDISNIQRCSNQNKVTEYKNLVEFLFSKLGPMQINQLKYICFWKDTKSAQVKSTVQKIGRTAVNTATSANDVSGGCLGAIFEKLIGFIVMIVFLLIIGGIIEVISLFFD
jgi:hypothetical protein